jgi:hypothetical protein
VVPTRYDHQAIRFEFEGPILEIPDALIDSKRVVSRKVLLSRSRRLAFYRSPVSLSRCLCRVTQTVDSVIWSSRTSN